MTKVSNALSVECFPYSNRRKCLKWQVAKQSVNIFNIFEAGAEGGAEMTPFSLDLKLPRGIFVLSMQSLHICYPICSVFSRKMKEREEEELGMKK